MNKFYKVLLAIMLSCTVFIGCNTTELDSERDRYKAGHKALITTVQVLKPLIKHNKIKKEDAKKILFIIKQADTALDNWEKKLLKKESAPQLELQFQQLLQALQDYEKEFK